MDPSLSAEHGPVRPVLYEVPFLEADVAATVRLSLKDDPTAARKTLDSLWTDIKLVPVAGELDGR